MDFTDLKDSKKETSTETVRLGRRATWVGFWCNALLGVLKVFAGLMGRSGALVADGLHSFSDFITDVVVLVVVGLARKKPSSHYQYGLGKYETFATMIIAILLVVVGVAIFIDALQKVVLYIEGGDLPSPSWIALCICALSIVAKEWLFRYTKRIGVAIQSSAVVANAWHHRSDAFSSVATFVGVGGAVVLGARWSILDPLAAVIVAVFIFCMGLKMTFPAIEELLEKSLPEELENEIKQVIAATPGVKTFHHLRTRRNGFRVIVEVHLKIDADITVAEGHRIATNAEERLSKLVAGEALITTHIEPYKGEAIEGDGSCS